MSANDVRARQAIGDTPRSADQQPSSAPSGQAPSIEDVLTWVGRLEGCSLLLLLGVAMPLKYVLKLGEPNAYIGWAHGSLFLLYLLCLGSARRSSPLPARHRWLNYGLGLIASVIPAGTFMLEWYLRRSRSGSESNFDAATSPGA